MYREQALAIVAFVSLAAVCRTASNQTGPHERVTSRQTARVSGNITIGAIFPVHTPPSHKYGYSRNCGPVRERGIHAVEMFLLTLDLINLDNSTLPGITIGGVVRDSCSDTKVAMESAIDAVKGHINDANASEPEYAKCSTIHPEPIAAMIGPSMNALSMAYLGLMYTFGIPQIGYSVVDSYFLDKARFPYFVSTAPTVMDHARAVEKILVRYKWTYVSVVSSEDPHSFDLSDHFERFLKEDDICIATMHRVRHSATPDIYDYIITDILNRRNSRVLVCICKQSTVRGLLGAIHRRNAHGQIVIVATNDWLVRQDVVEGFEEAAVGGISVIPHSPQPLFFKDYFMSLRPSTNTRNPWFKEYWQQKFSCYLPGEDTDSLYTDPCTGNETITEVRDYGDLPFVMNAVNTVVAAFHNMRSDVCGGEPGLCADMKPYDGEQVLSYRENKGSSASTSFDILNYQSKPEYGGAQYEHRFVGKWNSDMLTMNDDLIQWPTAAEDPQGHHTVPLSVCSEPCGDNEVKVFAGDHCCWLCVRCADGEVPMDEVTCGPA